MDTDVVQLRTGYSLVTDLTDLILRFCRDRGDGLCVTSLFRTQPRASH
jgi:hypothetical protein